MARLVKVTAGCILVGLSILIFKYAHITTGGTTGLALNLAYLFKMPFDYLFFIVNVPFYIFSIRCMGWSFTFSTILSVGFVSLLTGIERYLPDVVIASWSGAVLGGVLMGLGLSLLFIGKSSIAGIGVVTVYLQRKFGWNPGQINFIFDAAVVALGAFAVNNFGNAFFSALSIVIISFIISFAKKWIAVAYIAEAPHPD